MFNNNPIFVGLEVGTSKVCCAVCELVDERDLKLLGIGQSASHGVRKGEIVDPKAVEKDIQKAISKAEENANVRIRSLYLGVSGGHIRGQNNRGRHTIVSPTRQVSDEDIQNVVKNARATCLPVENNTIHTIRQKFRLDGHGGIRNPITMLGSDLELDMHIIHGNHNRLQNSIRPMKGLDTEVEQVAFNGLCTALSTLDKNQKELGALVIDIGGGTTDYILYHGGTVRHSGVLPVGGDHITNDLAIGLKVPLKKAEKLKIEHGAAVIDENVRGREITVGGDTLTRNSINLEHLQRIMSLRVEEILELVAKDLDEHGLIEYLTAGVTIAGGGAHIPGICKLASNIFDCEVKKATVRGVTGPQAVLDKPEFAAAFGLVRFGSMRPREAQIASRGISGLVSAVGSLFKRF